jgi:hypothetical protein
VCALLVLLAGAGPALAIHQGDIPVIQSLAHQLHQAAEHAHHSAEENAHHFTWWERQLLRDMHHFAEDVGHFHRTVHSYFSTPQHVLGHLQHVNQWAARVNRQIYWAHSFHHVVHDWQRAMLILRQINGYFYTGGGHDGGHDGHPTPRDAVRREGFERLHPAR